ncbi:MAG: hypothetical protein EBY21_13000 [Alphaproteobacteria bacterium]|nr:hypothetical protein [Alphaproteobacteria bacterium]
MAELSRALALILRSFKSSLFLKTFFKRGWAFPILGWRDGAWPSPALAKAVRRRLVHKKAICYVPHAFGIVMRLR